MALEEKKYFPELESDCPFKYTCWNLCKNPVNSDLVGHTSSGNHGKLWLAESPACSLCFAVLHNMLVYQQFSVLTIMLSIKCSFRNAGARDHPRCLRGETNRAAEENVQHCWWRHLHLGLHHSAAELLPLGDVPAWNGPRADQTGGEADVLHHRGRDAQ